MTNKKLQPSIGRGLVTNGQAGEQMPMPVRHNTEREQVGGAAGSARAFLGTARASLKPAQQEAMELWKKESRERSVRIRSDNTSSSLRARSPLPPRLPPFVGCEGSRSTLKSYLPYLTTSDIPMYLTLLYVQVRACVREESVPTRRCTDYAHGRFSSRQRYPTLKTL